MDKVTVSILALFYVWTKSLMCNDAANRDSTFQNKVRRISKFPVSRSDDVSSRLDAHLSTDPFVWTTCLSVRTSDRQASSVWTTCFFRPDTYIISRSFYANLLRPDVSAARPNANQFSNGSLILSKYQEREDQTPINSRTDHWFFPSIKKGKINQPSGRCGIPSGRVSPKGQNRSSKWTVRTSDSCGPDAGASYMVTGDSTSTVRTSPSHGPNARASDMEIVCWSLAIRTLLPHGPDARSLLWKLLAADVRQSRRSSHPVRTMFLYRKDFSTKILENPIAKLSVRTAMVHRPDGSQAKFVWRPFWPPAYK
jgi:hypothetical protein